MVRVSEQDYHDLLNLIYSANRCQDPETLVDTLCRSLMNSFNSECVTFHLLNETPGELNVIEARSFKNDLQNVVEDDIYPALYKNGYFQQSPLLHVATSSSRTVFKISDSLSCKKWEMSDYYNDFILPQHLYWEMFLSLRWANRLEGMLTLWRSRKELDFSQDDVVRAELLAPHVALAVRNVNIFSKVQNWKKENYGPELDDEGVLLLDHKLRPMYSNIKAREICLLLYQAHNITSIDLEKGDFPIPYYIIEDCNDLSERVKADKNCACWPKERKIFAGNGKRYRCVTTLVWKTDRHYSAPNFVVTLSDLSGRRDRIENNLHAKYNLSRREIDIIFCMISDMTYEETAEKLCISKLTVHTHIKNIHRKLGVRNKIELYHCINNQDWM